MNWSARSPYRTPFDLLPKWYTGKINSGLNKYGLYNISKPELLDQLKKLMPKIYQKCGKKFGGEATVLFGYEVSILSR